MTNAIKMSFSTAKKLSEELVKAEYSDKNKKEGFDSNELLIAHNILFEKGILNSCSVLTNGSLKKFSDTLNQKIEILEESPKYFESSSKILGCGPSRPRKTCQYEFKHFVVFEYLNEKSILPDITYTSEAGRQVYCSSEPCMPF